MSAGFDVILHASSVALSGQGLLILGASGAGKSTLALALMAHGAELVADDRIGIRKTAAGLVADCPEPIRGRIEARGIGLLNARAAGPARLVLVVDLDRPEPDRLPPDRTHDLLGLRLPLVLGQGHPHLAPALLQYLIAGRWDRDQS